jgi:hypothetical protein
VLRIVTLNHCYHPYHRQQKISRQFFFQKNLAKFSSVTSATNPDYVFLNSRLGRNLSLQSLNRNSHYPNEIASPTYQLPSSTNQNYQPPSSTNQRDSLFEHLITLHTPLTLCPKIHISFSEETITHSLCINTHLTAFFNSPYSLYRFDKNAESFRITFFVTTY